MSAEAVNRFGTKWPYKFMDDPFLGTKRPRVAGSPGPSPLLLERRLVENDTYSDAEVVERPL